MVEQLEKRLGKLASPIVDAVKEAFSVDHVNPQKNWRSMPYLKDELADEVASNIGNPGFRSNLYSAVNKDVLKRVYYGILSSGKLPKEYMQALTDWEKVFLFRGRWSERHPDLDEELPTLTSKHLCLGLNKLESDHYVRKAKGQYSSDKKFPEADRVREDHKRIVIVPRTAIFDEPIRAPEKPSEGQMDLFNLGGQ